MRGLDYESPVEDNSDVAPGILPVPQADVRADNAT